MKTCPEPCDLSYIVCPESFYHSTAQSCFPPDFLPVTAGRKRKVFQLCSYNFMLNVNKRPELCVLVFAFLLLTVLSHLLFYPILSFLLAILLAVWSLRSHSGRSQLGDRQPQLSCQALPAVPGWGGCQVQHGDSGSILGVSQLQSCRWFSRVWLGTCSHFTLTATGFHPAPEGSVSRDLAQNSEITDISLNGNTVTIFHLDHLISSAWLAMKHSDS